MRARALVLGVTALACGCRGGSVAEAPPAVGAIPVAPAAETNESREAGAPALDEGMPALSPVLDDPRLAEARDREAAHDASAAARAVDDALARTSLDGAHACAWTYVAARLHLDAGEAAEAAAGFDRARSAGGDGAAPCPLAAYASLRGAEALVRAGRFDDAIARARSVGDGIAARDETRLLLADAYAGKGDRASAVPIWRALLAQSPRGVRWVDTSVRLALALVDGVDGPPETHAQEAFDLATRVLVETPMAAEKTDVLAARARAAALVKPLASLFLSPDERARQAQAWLDASQPKRALETAEALLKELPKGDRKHRDAACEASIVRAQAMRRGKAEDAADAWGDAIARCEGVGGHRAPADHEKTDDDALATALYHGGKASAAAHRRDEALRRFARVEKLFPDHRLADDARFRAAQVVYDEGDEAKYVSMLASIADAYPDGDMKAEALFLVALEKLGKHDVAGARAALDRLASLAPDDHASPAPGRIAYFRARVAELAGDREDAKARYAEIVSRWPLGYYMLLAYGRLRTLDEGAARATLDAAQAREPKGPFLTCPHPELASPAFVRFQRLLEVGETDAARREASAAGLTAAGVDPEVAWTVAWSYDRAGDPGIGHGFARSRLVDYRSHWPSGRWRLAWQVAYPRPWADAVEKGSRDAGVPQALTWAVMREESAFDPDAHSHANAIGLMQLLTGTARLVARMPRSGAGANGDVPKGTPFVVDEAALHEPEVSIGLGTRLLAQLRTSFAADPALAIAAYNGGAGAVRRWLSERGGEDFDVFVERIPFGETRNYLERVLASEAAYAYLYAPASLGELLALPRRASGQEMIASP